MILMVLLFFMWLCLLYVLIFFKDMFDDFFVVKLNKKLEDVILVFMVFVLLILDIVSIVKLVVVFMLGFEFIVDDVFLEEDFVK